MHQSGHNNVWLGCLPHDWGVDWGVLIMNASRSIWLWCILEQDTLSLLFVDLKILLAKWHGIDCTLNGRLTVESKLQLDGKMIEDDKLIEGKIHLADFNVIIWVTLSSHLIIYTDKWYSIAHTFLFMIFKMSTFKIYNTIGTAFNYFLIT